MRFYTRQHKFYCGIDLHARSMYVCVLDQEGSVLVSQNIASAPEPFLELMVPYREDVVVAVECMFGSVAIEFKSSVFADDGGATSPNHTGSPSSKLAATPPTRA